MIRTKTAPTSLSNGHRKLAGFGIDLPQMPVTTVGSLPKHTELMELRYKVSKGVQAPSELERKERLSTEMWVREQERLGLDVLVDGEMNRGDFVQFFAKKIDGFETGGTVRCYGNRYYGKPAIRRKLQWKEPLIVDAWRSVQRMTHRPLKAILTGPYTLLDWSFDEFYNSRETALADITAILKKEIASLVENGAKIIQIDEPAMSARPEEFTLVANAIKEITAGFKCYFTIHHCYGELAPIWPRMIALPVDSFSFEMANSNYAALPLFKKFPTDKDICAGVVDAHNHGAETPQLIRKRIDRVLAVIPKKQLWIAPDCGLKTRTVDEALGKLRAMIQTTAKIRSPR